MRIYLMQTPKHRRGQSPKVRADFDRGAKAPLFHDATRAQSTMKDELILALFWGKAAESALAVAKM